jgi:hypothetical protein
MGTNMETPKNNGPEAAMNETPDLTPTPPLLAAGESMAPSQPPFIFWLKRLLACNPFYLVSAALLLYGFYRVSVDPSFLHGEVAVLTFDLTSLQCYELLLVVTAIFLARREIWYDSMLFLDA